MKTQDIDNIITQLATDNNISLDDSFKIAKTCSKLLKDKEHEHIARDIIIRYLDVKNNVSVKTHYMWNDIVEAAGLYPYNTKDKLTGAARLRYEYHKSNYINNMVLHEEQAEISNALARGENVVLSAPTSFGKSLLIEEIVASNRYSNIVIVQPTLALLDETRKKLQIYNDKYKILVSTSQVPAVDRSNLYLFTAERVVEYDKFKTIDIFIVDEFYKLSMDRDDDRAIALNHAFYKLLKLCNKFYFLGPMIKSIPDEFISKYNIRWHHTKFSTVAVNEHDIKFVGKVKKEDTKYHLYELLKQQTEPTLIYCASPESATNLASDFCEYIDTDNNSKPSSTVSEMIEWLEENVHPDWSLIKCLNNKIGIHHGAIPRHLGSSIVDAFNAHDIIFLFCTSTLIEGVNTSAKNVILYDKRKGMKPIDFFDYKNIAGRSGRMKKHFIGEVYRYHSEPQQMELEVDVPIITQVNAPLELLIQIDPNELSDKSKARLDKFSNVPAELMQVIKNNSGLPIDGQLQIINILQNNIYHYNKLLSWRSLPTYPQLYAVIELGWNHLLKTNESKAKIRNASQLTVVANKYIQLKSIAALINKTVNETYWINKIEDPQERVNTVVFNTLNMARHWFDYKLPKIVMAISLLQKYVFDSHGLSSGDYSFFARTLENGFIKTNLITLLEYDVPLSAIKKLEKYITDDVDTDEIIRRIHTIKLENIKLNKYEIKKLRAIRTN